MIESTPAIAIAKTIAKPFEGLRLKPYLCPAGVPTIGYGSTTYPDGRKVKLTDPPITVEYAEIMLDYGMDTAAKAVSRYCPALASDPRKLGAITDFVFNLGAGRLQYSTLRRRTNQRDWPEVRYELSRWVRGGGKILPGLVARRAVEAKYIGD
jgi:lysozyme